MKTKLQYIVPFAAFLVLMGFFVWRLGEAERGQTPDLIPSVMIDKPAPRFDLPPLYTGRAGFKTADLKGKVTLVNFFASWCVPCRAEHPVLAEIDRAGIVLVGINYKDKPDDAKAFLAEQGNPYRFVAVDRVGRTGIDFGVYGVPESYLIDRRGVIRLKETGPLTPEIVRDQIVPLAEKLK